jgi:hypothetical protein
MNDVSGLPAFLSLLHDAIYALPVAASSIERAIPILFSGLQSI